LRRKEDGIRYGMKPKQRVVGISIGKHLANARSVALAQEMTELTANANEDAVFMHLLQ